MLYKVITSHHDAQAALKYRYQLRPDSCLEVKVLDHRVMLIIDGDRETIRTSFEHSRRLGFIVNFVIQPMKWEDDSAETTVRTV